MIPASVRKISGSPKPSDLQNQQEKSGINLGFHEKGIFKSILYILLLICYLDTSAQTVFFSDNCQSNTGWTLGAGTPTGSGDYTAWRISNLSTCSIDSNSLSINGYNTTVANNWSCSYYDNGTLDIKAYKTVNAQNYQSLELEFDWFSNGEYSSGGATAYDYGQVGYSTNGGSSFTWFSTGGFNNQGKYYSTAAITRGQKITLPSALNNSQFVIGFRWVNDGSVGNDPGFIVDNIKLRGTATGGTPEPLEATVFSDKCTSDKGWFLTAGTPISSGDYTAWRISDIGTCSIDGNSLAINGWNTTVANSWSCGYYDNQSLDIKAFKAVDARNYETLQLKFDWICNGEYSGGGTAYDYGQVGYSTDGGLSFTWLSTGGINNQGKYFSNNSRQSQTISLPATLNNREFLIAFRWINDASVGNDPGFITDNIKVTGLPRSIVANSICEDAFDSDVSWQLGRANPDGSGNIVSWNIDNRCSINGTSLSINLYNNSIKDWQCGFAGTAATDIIAQRPLNASNAENLSLQMDWQVTSTSGADYGQLGYSTDEGQNFTWLNYGGKNNSGKYYNQAALIKGELVPLPESLSGKTFQLGFRWINDASSNTGQAFVIDNLKLIGLVKDVSFTPSNDIQKKVNRVGIEMLQVAGKKTDGDVDALNETGKISQNEYFDGFARNIQHVTVKGSPLKNDLVQPVRYDIVGRKSTDYLAYQAGSSNGAFRADAFPEQDVYYTTAKANFHTTEYSFSKTIFEPSPMNRTSKQGSEGKEFQTDIPGAKAKEQKFYTGIDNSSTSVSESIKRITVYPGSLNLLVELYSADNGLSPLWITEVKDEDSKIKRTYKDNTGKVILERQYAPDGTTILSQTYYVYDELERLRVVIQPEGIAAIPGIPISLSPSFNDTWCFQYNYDERGRMVSKKVPAGGWVEMAYDQWDRLAVTQDANQLAKNPQEFSYMKYDCQNRLIMTGTFTRTGGLDIATVRTELAAFTQRYETRSTGTYNDYSNNQAYPQDNGSNQLKIMTVNYYDDYNYTELSPYSFAAYLGYTNADIITKTRGLLTGTKARKLETDTYIYAANFYDQYDRLIQVQKNNGVKSFFTSKYNFLGLVTEIHEDNKLTASVGVNLKTRNEYDHMGRLSRLFHTTASQSEILLAEYKYTDLGRMSEKNLHSTNSGSSFLQSVDYTYNERGWLSHINNADLSNDGTYNNDANDLFGFELKYYKGLQIVAANEHYNGNVAEAHWKSSHDNKKKGYQYTYDHLNRLTAANYRVYSGSWTGSTENNRFNLAGIAYDKNGNITALQHTGPLNGGNYGTMDNLSYTYDGNRLLRVGDGVGSTLFYANDFENGSNSGDDYTYDENGNATSDLNKNISSIAYNILNLPQLITFSNGNKITYSYDATGVKLKKEVYTGATLTTTVNYWGQAQYLNGAVEFAFTPEGRTYNNGGTYKYDYFIKDHLGNARITFNASTGGTAQIVQVDDYYPFGNPFNSVTPSGKNKYLYNGKEQQDEFGLNWFDYGARFLDPQIGRWHAVDNLSEQNLSLSPYQYVSNDPINMIDPDGNNGFKSETAPQDIMKIVPLASTDELEGGFRYDNGEYAKEPAGDGPEFTQPSSAEAYEKDPLKAGLHDLSVAFAEALGVNTLVRAFYTLTDDKADGGDKFQAIAEVGLVGRPGRSTKSEIGFNTEKGRLNLYKFGSEQATSSTGWKLGDNFLNLPDKGSSKLNWKQNYGALRREMNSGNPIYDSYRQPNGNLISTSGFLNAERYTLQNRGWTYNQQMGAWLPPNKFILPKK